MAIMIPPIPREYTVVSKEGEIFEAFKNLSDDHYVLHSLGMFFIDNKNDLIEKEIDFVIFNKDKGIIIVEAKAGKVRYEDGRWLYASGLPMPKGGPFNQAQNNKYKLRDFISAKGNRFDINSKCSFIHAVCFPSINKGEIFSKVFPSEGLKETIISRNDLENIGPAIERIYIIANSRHEHKGLTKVAVDYLINNILCPTFDLVPSVSYKHNINNMRFNILLDEQKKVLNFLEDQKSAIINGRAGTGKTMIALEKANRHSAQEEKVLFLCYNKKLQEYLANNFRNQYIDFYTIDKFAYQYTKTSFNTYSVLEDKLYRYLDDAEKFEYDHVIIDEGQDFGIDNIEDEGIIELLCAIMDEKQGSFYIFYDKLQLVQGRKLPEYISDADCKITLYKNCRNTFNIAKNSMSLLLEDPKLREGAIKGEVPECLIIDNASKTKEVLEKFIKQLHENKITDIVVLTAKTLETTSVKDYLSNEKIILNNKDITVSTIRKFKGLEADVIILIDIEEKTILEEKLLYYVGTSRAKLYLKTIINLNDLEITNLSSYFEIPKGRNKKKQFAAYFNSYLVSL